MSATIPTQEGGTYPRKKIERSLVEVMAAALALAIFVVFATEARAGSSDSQPPEAVLMKYKTVLQAQGNAAGSWHYYEEGWNYIIYDNFGEYDFPEPDTVGAGRRLHVRFDKPERPSAVTINAWPRVKDGYDFEIPAGQRRQLERTLMPVKQGGETVGWDVFFRVNQPERHYYLVVRSGWERVPGTHISYGKNISYGLHVRTR
ncbi:MAG: hypothetical protein H0U55_04465 [Rubrobacteraceae bacterium]|nr:hypothetical protein [Rubrobacteraceae bacterium]